MDWLVNAANIFSITCALLSLGGWAWWMLRRERFFAWVWFPSSTERPPQIIGLLDLFVAFVVLVFAESAVATIFSSSQPTPATQSTAAKDPAESRSLGGNASGTSPVASTQISSASLPNARLLFARAAGHVGVVIFLVAWLMLRHQATIAECGFDLQQLRNGLRLGIVFSILLIPVVLAIQIALVNWGKIPYEHTTLKAMTESSAAAYWIATFLSAGIATPILEEYLYRFLMQGWLQRLIATIRDGSLANAGSTHPHPRLLFGGRDQDLTAHRYTDPLQWTAVFFASLLFAAAHLGQGAAPIPLFFFAVGLGFLRWRSGNVFSPIVVHMVLNLYTLTMVTLQQLASA